jgi:hypothetical protein
MTGEPDDDPVPTKGFFYKQSKHDRRDWRLRYYVIDVKKSTLTYYKNVKGEGKGAGNAKSKGKGETTDSWKLKGQVDLRGASFGEQDQERASFGEQDQERKRGPSIVKNIAEDSGSERNEGKGKYSGGSDADRRSKCSERLTLLSYVGLFVSFTFDAAICGLFCYQSVGRKSVVGCALAALLFFSLALLLFLAFWYRKSRGIWVACLLATAYLTLLGSIGWVVLSFALGTGSIPDLPDWTWAVFALVLILQFGSAQKLLGKTDRIGERKLGKVLSKVKSFCSKPCKQCVHRMKKGKKKRLEKVKHDALLASDLPKENPLHGLRGSVPKHVMVLHAFSTRDVKGLKHWEANQEQKVVIGFETGAEEKGFIRAIENCTITMKEGILKEIRERRLSKQVNIQTDVRGE